MERIKSVSVLILLLALLSINVLGAQTQEDAIVGTWHTEAKDGKMEIFKVGDEYQGKLVWGKAVVNADGTSKKDINNPDASLRDRDIAGIVFLKDLKYDGEEWDGGKVYDHASGKWYDCYVWLKGGVLHLRGYVGMRMMGQTSKWTK